MKRAALLIALVSVSAWFSVSYASVIAPKTDVNSDFSRKKHRDGGRGEEGEEDFRRMPPFETTPNTQ